MTHTFAAKYQIGQRIYHVIPESNVGFILDISFSVRKKEVSYLIALGFDNEVWAFESELSNERIII